MTAATDPVCGMLVEDDEGVLASTHRGRRYVFCSPRCKQAFESDPARYATLERKPAQPAAVTSRASAAGTKELAKDPVCGMMVDKATSLRAERGGALAGIIAAAAMALSSLSVIVNSTTLKRLWLSHEQPGAGRPGGRAQPAMG